MRHLIDPLDFTLEETKNILDLADRIKQNPDAYSHVADGKRIATLFYEPSTRTRLSFESAMLSLGGQVIGFAGAEMSSASKGETVADTSRVVSCYADIIAMRHPKEGAPLVASMYSSIPVINAGDGGHNHPTQTLIDLMTIRQLKGHLDNITIGFCGDLKFGRTVHSLVNSLVRYENNRFYFISPDELKVPAYTIEDTLKPHNSEYYEVSSLEETLPKLDVLYMTRVQKERFLAKMNTYASKIHIFSTVKNLILPSLICRFYTHFQELMKYQQTLMTTTVLHISSRYRTENMYVWQ